jgi:hypothetical protein
MRPRIRLRLASGPALMAFVASHPGALRPAQSTIAGELP